MPKCCFISIYVYIFIYRRLYTNLSWEPLMRLATTRTRKSNTRNTTSCYTQKPVTKHKHSESFKWLGQNPSYNTNSSTDRTQIKFGRSVRICICICARVRKRFKQTRMLAPKTLKQLDNTLSAILHESSFHFLSFFWFTVMVENKSILIHWLRHSVRNLCFDKRSTVLKSETQTTRFTTEHKLKYWCEWSVYCMKLDAITSNELRFYHTNHWLAHQSKRVNDVIGSDELV